MKIREQTAARAPRGDVMMLAALLTVPDLDELLRRWRSKEGGPPEGSGLSSHEIAAVTGLSHTRVLQLSRRAMEKLKRAARRQREGEA